MGLLPLARNRTYTPSTPVVSGDLNDLQDAVIATNTLLTGQRKRSIPFLPSLWSQEAGSPGVITFDGVSGGYKGTFSLAAGIAIAPLDFLKPGDRVLSVRISYEDGIAAPTPIIRYLRSGWSTYAVAFTYDPTGDGTPSAGWRTQRWLATVPTAIWLYNPTPGTPSNDSWAMNAVLSIVASQNVSPVYGVEVLYDTQPVIEAT